MNIALWILQGLLGAAYAVGGTFKVFAQKKLAEKQAWIRAEKPGLITFIGISEVLGGLGLVLPGATRTLTVLTPLAALGLGLVMVLAVGYRLGRKENKELVFDLGLGCLVAFIAVGRFVFCPL